MTNLEKALELHRKSPVVDAHLDLAAEIFFRRRNGERGIIKHRYLDNLKKAGFRLIVSSIYVDGDYPSTCLRQALEQIVALKEDIKECDGQVEFVSSRKELASVLSSGHIGIMLSFEGLEAIENNSELLYAFYDLGVRGAGLVWSRRNFVADGCMSETKEQGKKGGLTGFGVEVVRKLESIGMFLDVSHLNEEGFWDLMKFSKGPVIASHSVFRSVCDTNRSLCDEQLMAIAKRNGVVGIHAIKQVLGVVRKEECIQKMCDHIDHAVRLVGVAHVGFGFDLCDSCMEPLQRVGDPELDYDALSNHGEAVLITEELLARGYGEDDLLKITGQNLIGVYESILK